MRLLAVASGIELTSPLLVVTNITSSNSLSVTEALNQDNEITRINNGAHVCNFRVGVFASEQSFIDKLPPLN